MRRPVTQVRQTQVPQVKVGRSQFNRSHRYLTTFDAGWLIPILVDYILPGDTINLALRAFARLATPLKPFMDNLYMEWFIFFTPMRLVWTNFVKMMGEQANPGDSISYVVPQISNPGGGWTVGSLGDYFTLPIHATGFTCSALPFRAYYLTYNTWFRDQNLINSLTVPLTDGPDLGTNYVLQRRGKRHDYFTSCLPAPQKGAAVTVPLGTTAPVKGIGFTAANVAAPVANVRTVPPLASPVTYAFGLAANTAGFQFEMDSAGGATGRPLIYADLSLASAATINQWRQAFQIQRLLEKDARGGTRYIEKVYSQFGVVSPDARLQRPEYLGGGSAMVNVSPIAQTGEAGTTPQGNLAAMGTVSASQRPVVKSFTEHGILMVLVSVRADLTYQQGLERFWSYATQYDFPMPVLAHIGEQAVLNKEIFHQGTAADDLVFGYQERYAEARYKPSRITGLFRSDAAGTLQVWHLSQDFAALPTLNKTFIEEDPPVDRVIAVPAEPHFIFDGWFDYLHARPLPVYGVPGFIDHF